MTTKTLDSKGRVTLGPAYANRTVLIDDSDATRIIITPAVVIPEHEAWLYKNEKALHSVVVGIEQARLGQFATDLPDLGVDTPADEED
ncbi:MAG: hypothetical protein SH868_20000 [Bythopirellula sp.]|nr:hypothetical protein [Bythopirellula sp.]